MATLKLVLLGLIVSLIYQLPAHAQYVPEKIAFQGYLQNKSAKAITTSTAMRFGLYIDGTRYWYARYAVSFSNGRFSIMLGDTALSGQALDPITGDPIANSNLPI